MSDQLPSAVKEAIKLWAARTVEVRAAYVFGSRAKGTAGAGSDLDVALELDGDDEGERLGNWVCCAAAWRRELGAMLPFPLDLQPIFPDDERVAPAVADHGLLVFKR